MTEKEIREMIWSICQEIRMVRLSEGEASIKILALIKENYVSKEEIEKLKNPYAELIRVKISPEDSVLDDPQAAAFEQCRQKILSLKSTLLGKKG